MYGRREMGRYALFSCGMDALASSDYKQCTPPSSESHFSRTFHLIERTGYSTVDRAFRGNSTSCLNPWNITSLGTTTKEISSEDIMIIRRLKEIIGTEREVKAPNGN